MIKPKSTEKENTLNSFKNETKEVILYKLRLINGLRGGAF